MIYFAIILTTLIKLLSVSNILTNPFLYICLSVFEADDKPFCFAVRFCCMCKFSSCFIFTVLSLIGHAKL